ncbi:hypothetical protein DES53_115119 [Roseimicrobium gellanilyticum]|uniref:Uncharacterized protein n=1 Tax=Roseimicrobium gellanilyticum TaxID=748857 RepID=A0A366H4Y7_9BACT|nr:hypothetical protein [Roseimicrobium gellanilyticum]RBP36978.1 hypothetical protein DES53_115119 [Roseimicrobium gellanilyticum]
MDEPDPASSDADGSSYTRGLAWGLCLLVAVPVLYLLSVPPVVIYALDVAPRPPGVYGPPKWLVVYVAPAEWMITGTSFEDPMRKYSEWCRSMMGAP